MTIWTQDNIRRGGFLEEYESSLSDYLGATVDEAFTYNPTPSLVRSGRLRAAEEGQLNLPTRLALTALGTVYPPAAAYNVAEAPGLPSFFRNEPDSPVVDAEAARARIKEEGLDLTVPDTGIRSRALDILIERKKEERKRNDVLNRGPGGLTAGALRVGTMLGTSALDPLNIASAFVPVVGPARYAAALKGASGAFGRAGVRAGVGAVEGAAGAALVEPLVYGAAQQEQADYGLADSLLNIGLGTALGGGLHVGAGVVGDWRTARAPKDAPIPRLLERVDAGTREQALRTSVAQAVEGRAIDVEPVLQGVEPSRVPSSRVETIQGQAGRTMDDLYAVAPKHQQTLEELGRAIGDEVGVEFRTPGVKDRAIAEGKLARKGYKDASQITDIVRAGFVARMPAQAEAIIERLKGKLEVIDEGWKITPYGYFDRKVLVRFDDGTVGEVQIWEPNLFAAKEGEGYKLYSEMRALPLGDPKRADLEKRQIELYSHALRTASPDWGNLISPNVSRNASGVIQEPLSPTSAGSTSVQPSPGARTAQARTPSMIAGRPSQSTNFNDASNVRLFDDAAVRAADERIAAAPKDEDMPETSLAEVLEDVQRLTTTLDDSELVTRELGEFDELAATAATYGKAVRAAAECRLSRGA